MQIRQRNLRRAGAGSIVLSLAASAVLATFLTIGATTAPAQAASADPVAIPDAALDRCVRGITGVDEPTPVTEGDMAKISVFACQYANVSDLSGLEHASNLVHLDLGGGNQISDVSPLGGLTNLRSLSLIGNHIKDPAPLGGLPSLVSLSLDYNQIDDVSGLADLTGLERLSLDNNQVADVSPLAGLTGLLHLSMYSNHVADVSPLVGMSSVEVVRLDDNQIADVSPFSEMPALRTLFLNRNHIADVSSLSVGTEFDYLALSNQVLPQGSAITGVPTPLPAVIDHTGASAPLNVSTGSGVITGRDVVWGTPGSGSLGWSVPVTFGNASAIFSGTQPITIGAALPITLSGAPMNGVVGETYSYAFAVAGNPAPSVTVTDGALPDGLTLSTSGVLTGTPKVAGSYSFTLSATNGVAGDAVLRDVVIVVTEPTSEPTPEATPTVAPATASATHDLASTGGEAGAALVLVGVATALLAAGAGVLSWRLRRGTSH